MNITINLYDKIKYEEGAKVQYRVQYSDVIKIYSCFIGLTERK